MEAALSDARLPLPVSQRRQYTLADAEMLVKERVQTVMNHEHLHSDVLDDTALIQSFQNGCDSCYEILFARYWKLVFTIAWKILRQKTDAEDIVQDVFLTIYLQRDRYDSTRGSVKTWIGQFAHFKALLRRRYLQTREQRNLDDFSEFESELLRFGSSHGVLERAAFVEECLAALNPRQRRTVELVHFDGYTLLETSAVLKQSLANTRNLYYRGMKTLRTQLKTPHTLAMKSEKKTDGAIGNPASESLAFGTDL